jgi:hypothetical protein
MGGVRWSGQKKKKKNEKKNEKNNFYVDFHVFALSHAGTVGMS